MENVLSSAAQVLIAIIPIVGIVMGSIVVFFGLLWRHHQNVKMIERGITPPVRFDLVSFTLLAGLVTSGVGFVLTVFLFLTDSGSYGLLGGLIPLAVGLSLLAYSMLRRNDGR